MKFLATVLSGLFIFAPSFLFSYYLSYMYGVTEYYGSSPSIIGSNYSEYIFLGYFELSIDVLKNINRILWLLLYFIIYLFIAFACLYLGTHHESRKKLILHIQVLESQFIGYVKRHKSDWVKSLNTIPFAICMLFLIYLFSLYPILIKNRLGALEAEKELTKIMHSKHCELNEGYMMNGENMTRLKKIICGSNKCIVVDLDHRVIKTILPEQFIQPIYLSEMRR